ncbi:unnamed protein product [Cochlearia groenlandica]
MISNPSLLLYSCIAKGSLILADFSHKEDPDLEALALRCIENLPPHHSMVSHTVHKRTYSLNIDGLFSYFAILDESVPKSESLWLFDRLKSAAAGLVSDGSTTDLSQYCLQSKLDPVFAEIAGSGGINKDFESESVANRSLDSSKGGAFTPLLGKPLNVLKNKKRLQTEVKSEKVDSRGCVLSKGLRNGLVHDHHHRQKAKQIWRKHVWIVLLFDVFVCVVLFGIWVWVCQGFQCIYG